MRTLIALVSLSASLWLAGCKKSEPEQRAASEPAAESAPDAHAAALAEEAAKSAASDAAKQPSAEPTQKPTIEVKIRVTGTSMKFDVSTISASVGQPVHLVLMNDKPGTLLHNWVLVKAGSEAAVAAAGLKVGEANGYLAPVPEVLAFTGMIAPGNTTEVTFVAPSEPGKYPYICTFPGHYLMMKGVLDVTS